MAKKDRVKSLLFVDSLQGHFDGTQQQIVCILKVLYSHCTAIQTSLQCQILLISQEVIPRKFMKHCVLVFPVAALFVGDWKAM